LSIVSAKYWKVCAEPGTSLLSMSEIGLPMSSVSSRANRAAFSRISRPYR
jgi:hypothetical protein